MCHNLCSDVQCLSLQADRCPPYGPGLWACLILAVLDPLWHSMQPIIVVFLKLSLPGFPAHQSGAQTSNPHLWIDILYLLEGVTSTHPPGPEGNISTPDLYGKKSPRKFPDACRVLDILPGAWDVWVSCVLVACFVLMDTAHQVLSYFSSHTFWPASSSFSTHPSGSCACHLSPFVSIPRRGYLSLSLHRPPWPTMATPPLGCVSIYPHPRTHPWLQLLIS